MHEIQMLVFNQKELTDNILLQMHRKIAALLRLPVSQSTLVTEAGQMEVKRLLQQPFAPLQPLNQWQAILVFPSTEMEAFILGQTEEFKILRRNTPFRFLEPALSVFNIDVPYQPQDLWNIVEPHVNKVLGRKSEKSFIRGARHFKLINGGVSK